MKDKDKNELKRLIRVLTTILLSCAVILYYLWLFLNSGSSQRLNSLTSIISIFISAIFVVYQVNKSHENAIKQLKISADIELQKEIKELLSEDNISKAEFDDSYLNLENSIEHLSSLATASNGYTGDEEREEAINNASFKEKSNYESEKNDILKSTFNYLNSLHQLNSKLKNISNYIYIHDMSRSNKNLIYSLNNCRSLLKQQRLNTLKVNHYTVGFVDNNQSDTEMAFFISAAKEVKKNNQLINKSIIELINYKKQNYDK